jgi:hypothetical protein
MLELQCGQQNKTFVVFDEQATRLLLNAGATGITTRMVFEKKMPAYTRGA